VILKSTVWNLNRRTMQSVFRVFGS
jgi:hypothetical protein